MLGNTQAVERRRVEIAQSRGVKTRERGGDRHIGVRRIRAAEGRGADAEQRDRDIAPTDSTSRSGIVAHDAGLARRLAMLCT